MTAKEERVPEYILQANYQAYVHSQWDFIWDLSK